MGASCSDAESLVAEGMNVEEGDGTRAGGGCTITEKVMCSGS
jgi:hypothetical protein